MEKIYLRDVIGLVWAARFYVLFSLIGCLIIAFLALLAARPQYEAALTLVPTRANQYASQTGGGGESLAGSFAGQLLGVGGSKDTQSAAQFVELMKSPFVVELIDRRYHIISHIFIGQWDAARGQWVRPTGLVVDLKNIVKAAMHRPLWVPPGSYEASVELASRTTVDISQDSGMVHLSIRDQDPAYGAFLLNSLYETTDNLLRERAKQRSDDHIAYIQKQLSTVSNTENRESLASLLTAELGQQLLINSNAPFVLEKLSPITVSPVPVSPKIFTYILAGIFAGIATGFGLFALDARFALFAKLHSGWRALLQPRLK